jgi:hypothetical protein
MSAKIPHLISIHIEREASYFPAEVQSASQEIETRYVPPAAGQGATRGCTYQSASLPMQGRLITAPPAPLVFSSY